jgi:proline dehydrogenase
VTARRLLFALATSEAFEKAVSRAPGARARAWRSARRYFAGETAEDALRVADALGHRGLRASLDLFGERVTDPAVAARVTDDYVRLAPRLPAGVWQSLDLSHVAFDGEALKRIAAALPDGARVQVGAEEASVTDRVLGAVLAAGGDRVDATVQANLRRSPADAVRLAEAGIPVRLVKGAYIEDRADALPWGAETDAAYARIALLLGEAGTGLRRATHDDALHRLLLPALPDADCELLLGVRPERAAALQAAGRRVRIYVPFGPDWFRYLMRRRAESRGV